MAIEKFSLAQLAVMDGGRHALAFQQAIDRMRFDCVDRAAVKGKRKVQLTVTLEPKANDNGDLDRVHVSFAIDDKAPKRESRTYSMQDTPGALVFNEVSPDEARQRTLDEGPRPRPLTEPGTNADNKTRAAGQG